MKIHEYQGKQLFAKFGVAVLENQVVTSPEQASQAFAKLGGNEDRVFSDQMRYTVGLGRALNDKWTLEIRYIREERRDIAGVDFEASSNVFELRLRSAARIADILKAR